MKKLIELRSELIAPKGQYNNFGKYNYRSCEDILEAVKPLLAKYELFMIMTDELVNIGERYYIKSSIIVSDGENDVLSEGYARESLTKKGMDESQITGSTSSYARKYALNAMFLIDDTKDADTDEQHKQTNKPEPKNQQSDSFNKQEKIDKIESLMDDKGITMGNREKVRADYAKAKTYADMKAIYDRVGAM